MNYAAHYDRLIFRARNRALVETYVERHHVLPRCLGGGDEPENIVCLTAQEHLVAHELLCKIHPNNGKLVFAVKAMLDWHIPGREAYMSKNKIYGWVRERISKEISEQNKKRLESPEARKELSDRAKRYHEENPEARIAISERQKKRFEDPAMRLEMSETKKRQYSENPEMSAAISERMVKFYEENPAIAVENSERFNRYYEENPSVRSERATKQFEDPAARDLVSEGLKRYYEENPEALVVMSERSTKQFEDPAAREHHSKVLTQYYIDNPEARDIASEKTIKQFEDPAMREKLSMSQKQRYANNPEVGKRNTEAGKARSPLTEEIVAQCRARYVPRCKVNGVCALAIEFGVSKQTMSRVVNGLRWA